MRLVTRGDLDGLTCAVLISRQEQVDEILLCHPQELADGVFEIQEGDIVANLPYQRGCALWFDHHLHTAAAPPTEVFKGAFGFAPSAARLVYEYYGGKRAMPEFADLVHETDRMDGAFLTLDDILDPQGYIKLGFTVDPRSGLGPLDEYFNKLVRLLIESPSVDQLLANPEVEERCRRLEQEDVELHEALRAHSKVDGNVVVADFRGLDRVPVGNRFLVFAVFPEVNVAVRVQWDEDKRFAMLTLGHSILNRTCRTNVGELAARYGGGGHRGAASIRLMDDPDQQIEMIFGELKANG